jgi:hypothetical protein
VSFVLYQRWLLIFVDWTVISWKISCVVCYLLVPYRHSSCFNFCDLCVQPVCCQCVFIPETHDGVQDMACDTFIKIALKCRRHFVTVQVGEVMPFIEEILTTISTIICDLQTQQVIVYDQLYWPGPTLCCVCVGILWLGDKQMHVLCEPPIIDTEQTLEIEWREIMFPGGILCFLVCYVFHPHGLLMLYL